MHIFKKNEAHQKKAPHLVKNSQQHTFDSSLIQKNMQCHLSYIGHWIIGQNAYEGHYVPDPKYGLDLGLTINRPLGIQG